MENFVGGIFCVVEIWGVVILTIQIFFKAKSNILYMCV